MRGTFLAAAGLIATACGAAATLSLGNQTAAAGQTLVASLGFASQGQPVSGIQFDLSSDASLLIGIMPGAQIGASAKILYTAALSNRSMRVLIVGMNQATLADGEILRPVISVDPSAAPGTASILIRNIAASDAEGNAVSVAPVTASVQIQSGAAGVSIAPGAVVNAASLLPGAVSPGEIVSILGSAALAGTAAVQFNGTAAPILYAGAGQVNAIAPFGLSLNGNANLQILTPAGPLAAVSLATAPVSPALFTQNGTGTGPGAILNQDYSANSFLNPAAAGSVIMLYGTGFGALNPPAADGQPAGGLAATVLPVTATIGGAPAQVIYAGAAPGLVAGLVQINVQISQNLTTNPAAPVQVSVGGMTSPAITVAIR